jgi:flagellar FliJ protein
VAKAFHFRLDRLLALRRQKAEVAQRDLAAAMQLVQDQNRKLLEMMAEQDEGKAALRALRMRELDLVRLQFQEDYLGALERRIRGEVDRLQEIVRAEVGKRRELTEAVRGVKVLERLRERRFRDWSREENRREGKVLDEVAQRMERAV